MNYNLSPQAAAAEARRVRQRAAPIRHALPTVPARPARASEERMITVSEVPGARDVLQIFGLSDIALPAITLDMALTVPAFASAVTFLPRALAALPLHAFRTTAKGPARISGGLQTLVHDAPNEEWSSYKLRKYFWSRVFTTGRGLAYIERDARDVQPVALWPMNPDLITIKRDAQGRTTYEETGSGRKWAARDVIDVPFMLKADGLSSYAPLQLAGKTLQLGVAMADYGAKFFAGGGVPPLALEGPLPQGPDAMKRAMADIWKSVEAAKANDKPVIPMPPGHKLTPIGFDPDKGQMTDGRRFLVEEIARIFGLPPVFLQDLTHGTFSNTEQQDLHLVKHLILQWTVDFEQEANLKLFGQRNAGRWINHNVDGLQRGDLRSRMEALAKGVQNALITPNEGRELENRPRIEGGDELLIQGATVPLGTQPVLKAPKEGENNTDEN